MPKIRKIYRAVFRENLVRERDRQRDRQTDRDGPKYKGSPDAIAKPSDQKEYLKRASEEIIKRKTENQTAEEISNNLVSSLKTAASEVLPNKTKTCIRQVWKDDQDLNSLLEERALTENKRTKN